MKRILLISAGAIVAILAVLVYVGFNRMKTISPEKTSFYEKDGLKIKVTYNSPSKRGREIFGGLVPYGKVWRTGANEPTIFETNEEITIQGKKLPKGTYSLWTIPNQNAWTVIFNSEIPFWGVNFNRQTTRETKNDVLLVDVPALIQEKEFEEFTISVEQGAEDAEIIFLWDKTLVAVPFSK
jgi:hypothetical protein